MKKTVRIFTGFVAVLVALAMSAVVYYDQALPNSFYTLQSKQEPFTIESAKLVEVEQAVGKLDFVGRDIGVDHAVQLKLFGVIPIKTAYLQQTKENEVVPCGTVFGIKLYTDGVLVIDLSSVQSAFGNVFPAKEAGIEKGDFLLSINGQEVMTNEDVKTLINQSEGKTLTLKLRRGDSLQTVQLHPEKGTDGQYKGGIWVRDSTAGIGTVTYYDPADGTFAGLGHAVCDVDTKEIMRISSGDVCGVTITGLTKGKSGTAGELQGVFTSDQPIGKLEYNNQTGVFGKLYQMPALGKALPVALKQSVHEGKATILCTLADNQVGEYEIEIEHIDLNPQTITKNMVIKITDPRLLEQTGGIVQGMSGSPVLQDGKLIGAVTHVFVNDPTKGYAIFAENMKDRF